MNWRWEDWPALLPLRERGRPGPRLARGLLWALAAIFVLSILIFVTFQCAPPIRHFA